MFTTIRVAGQPLAVDIVEELQPYFEGRNVRWTEDKVVSPSPFRYDGRPSFFVNLVHMDGKDTAGTWLDSGASEGDEFRSGKLEKLLAFLRGESVWETIHYLNERYGVKSYDTLKLNLDFKVRQNWTPLQVQGTEYAFDYLTGRGIDSEVIQNAKVMDLGDRIAIHWLSPNGEVIAIKFRDKKSKIFSYAKDGRRLNEYLYNLQRCYQKKAEFLWICEGEIDALTVESCLTNSVGIALGGTYFKANRRDLVLRTGVSNIVIATDNDSQGLAIGKEIQNQLRGMVDLFSINLEGCKDVNEFYQRFNRLPTPVWCQVKLFPNLIP